MACPNGVADGQGISFKPNGLTKDEILRLKIGGTDACVMSGTDFQIDGLTVKLIDLIDHHVCEVPGVPEKDCPYLAEISIAPAASTTGDTDQPWAALGIVASAVSGASLTVTTTKTIYLINRNRRRAARTRPPP